MFYILFLNVFDLISPVGVPSRWARLTSDPGDPAHGEHKRHRRTLRHNSELRHTTRTITERLGLCTQVRPALRPYVPSCAAVRCHTASTGRAHISHTNHRNRFKVVGWCSVLCLSIFSVHLRQPSVSSPFSIFYFVCAYEHAFWFSWQHVSALLLFITAFSCLSL